ncbi:MAG: hypothetical protein J1E95_03485 [Muribaculaceae bacterium]|nr:hypothetical protein [Muribaculaceae bacterium]
MKGYLRIILALCFSMSLLTGCKPTEKGYKAAYDAALGKRQAATVDIEIPEGALMDVEGPQLKEINGVSVYLLNDRIKMIEVGTRRPETYNVAVGCYKMITNCKSQVSDLKSDGYDAFGVKDSEDKYYSIAGSFGSIDEAVMLCKEFQKKKKDFTYVGLPDAPVIIFSPR